jgi:hypothetical protein
MRASAWSPLVEDGTIVFDLGLDLLIEAMLSVPQDRRQWDLVDAAGLVIRGFPVRPPLCDGSCAVVILPLDAARTSHAPAHSLGRSP